MRRQVCMTVIALVQRPAYGDKYDSVEGHTQIKSYLDLMHCRLAEIQTGPPFCRTQAQAIYEV